MLVSQRCGARIRCGGACRLPAVRGKNGAPRGNRNARKLRLFTKGAIADRKRIQALLGEARKLLQAMK
jgi:hypothetical protein